MSEINKIEELPEDTFLINIKLIQKYKQEEPIVMAKYKDGTYHEGYFRGGINLDINLITCKDKIFIPSILQSSVLHCYHMYLLHPVMDRTEAIICQNLYWHNIRYSV